MKLLLLIVSGFNHYIFGIRKVIKLTVIWRSVLVNCTEEEEAKQLHRFILRNAGLFKKVTKGRTEEEQLLLEFSIDEKTGAKLVGVDGHKLGLDKNYYQILNRSNLEKEKGFKIFVFHGMVSEYKPKDLSMMQSLPLSYLPKNFSYYAGGHLRRFKG